MTIYLFFNAKQVTLVPCHDSCKSKMAASTTAILDYACATYLLKYAVTLLTPVETCTWLMMQAQTGI